MFCLTADCCAVRDADSERKCTVARRGPPSFPSCTVHTIGAILTMFLEALGCKCVSTFAYVISRDYIGTLADCNNAQSFGDICWPQSVHGNTTYNARWQFEQPVSATIVAAR